MMMHVVTNSKKYFVMFLFTLLVAWCGSSKNTPKSDDLKIIYIIIL